MGFTIQPGLGAHLFCTGRYHTGFDVENEIWGNARFGNTYQRKHIQFKESCAQGIVILILLYGLLSKHIFMISTGVSPFPLRCASQIADSKNTCIWIYLSINIIYQGKGEETSLEATQPQDSHFNISRGLPQHIEIPKGKILNLICPSLLGRRKGGYKVGPYYLWMGWKNPSYPFIFVHFIGAPCPSTEQLDPGPDLVAL